MILDPIPWDRHTGSSQASDDARARHNEPREPPCPMRGDTTAADPPIGGFEGVVASSQKDKWEGKPHTGLDP